VPHRLMSSSLATGAGARNGQDVFGPRWGSARRKKRFNFPKRLRERASQWTEELRPASVGDRNVTACYAGPFRDRAAQESRRLRAGIMYGPRWGDWPRMRLGQAECSRGLLEVRQPLQATTWMLGIVRIPAAQACVGVKKNGRTAGDSLPPFKISSHLPGAAPGRCPDGRPYRLSGPLAVFPPVGRRIERLEHAFAGVRCRLGGRG